MDEFLEPRKEELQSALNTLSDMVRNKLITVKEAAKRAGMTEDEFVELTGLELVKKSL